MNRAHPYVQAMLYFTCRGGEYFGGTQGGDCKLERRAKGEAEMTELPSVLQQGGSGLIPQSESEGRRFEQLSEAARAGRRVRERFSVVY